ncbi:PAPS4, partial [Symbiodinium necroappetens]
SGYVARQTALAILESVPDKRAFQQLLTCVRFWAKQRGVYGQSHDFGYLGGAGWAICCALVCQIEQHQDLEQLLGAFFDIMSRWDCRVPVALNGRAHRQVQRNSAGLKVLLPVGRKLCANPNLTASAALQLQKEFRRGNRIFAKIQHSQADWKQIFSVSKFFERYFHYLQFDITASSEEIMFQWLSWCRQHLQGTAEMLETVGNCHLITRPWPVWLPFKDCEWHSAIAVFIALRVLPHTRNEPAGTRTVVDLREILVTLLERLCAWPLATEHLGEFDLYIRHTSQAEVKSWLTALEGGFPVKRAHRPTTQTQAAISLPEADSEDDMSRQSSSFEFQ